MVFMSMGKEDPNNIIEAIADIAKVRQNQINTWLVILWEENATINNQKLSISLIDSHIATDLRNPTECDDTKATSCKLGGCA
jgi:hypothetical protein